MNRKTFHTHRLLSAACFGLAASVLAVQPASAGGHGSPGERATQETAVSVQELRRQIQEMERRVAAIEAAAALTESAAARQIRVTSASKE